MKASQINTIELIEQHIQEFNPAVFEFEVAMGKDPYRILISVMLSARTKDTTTINAVKRLFHLADTPQKMLTIPLKKIEESIYPVGFYHRKASSIIKISREILEFGRVPDNFDDLTKLAGVGRKTANVVLVVAYNKPSIAVDTHVQRISWRLGFTDSKVLIKIEQDLKVLFPEKLWNKINKTLVGFGQTTCKPINPNCSNCPVKKFCRFANSI
jgi:endonuclease-3